MTDVAHLGGGYAASAPDPGPTTAALLQAARPGSPSSRLVVLGGPPAVGKTAVAQALLALCPNTFLLDKDQTAADFILEAAALRGDAPEAAYGAPHYWQKLRPLEYASTLAAACTNLVGTRQVLLVGGFGPELGVDSLWEGIATNIAPATLAVLHLNPPPLDIWRARMAGRGSRADASYFAQLAQALGNLPVWAGAVRIPTDGPLHLVVQRALNAID